MRSSSTAGHSITSHKSESESESEINNIDNSRIGKIGLAFAGTSLSLLLLGAGPFLRRFTGAPYVSSSVSARRAIAEMLSCHVLHGGAVVDLGSGSGELVLDAASHGLRATGYELNAWLVAASRWRAWRRGLHQSTHFVWKDMWQADVSSADAVVVFGVPDIMADIKRKIERECAEGCLICCNTFPVEGLNEVRRNGGVYFYVMQKENKNDLKVPVS